MIEDYTCEDETVVYDCDYVIDFAYENWKVTRRTELEDHNESLKTALADWRAGREEEENQWIAQRMADRDRWLGEGRPNAEEWEACRKAEKE